MTQVARPTADLSNSGWSPTPLYCYLNAPTPNDAAPVTSPELPPGGNFVVQLAPLADPTPGPQTLTVWFAETNAGDALVTFALLQASQLIAARSVQPTQAFTNYDLVLTQDEIDQITD